MVRYIYTDKHCNRSNVTLRQWIGQWNRWICGQSVDNRSSDSLSIVTIIVFRWTLCIDIVLHNQLYVILSANWLRNRMRNGDRSVLISTRCFNWILSMSDWELIWCLHWDTYWRRRWMIEMTTITYIHCIITDNEFTTD